MTDEQRLEEIDRELDGYEKSIPELRLFAHLGGEHARQYDLALQEQRNLREEGEQVVARLRPFWRRWLARRRPRCY